MSSGEQACDFPQGTFASPLSARTQLTEGVQVTVAERDLSYALLPAAQVYRKRLQTHIHSPFESYNCNVLVFLLSM